MPLTFPSHAAAILPLYRASGRLHPTALVIGSMAPDLAYLLRWSATISHQFCGLFTFCLPAGLLLFLWTEWLALPTLRQTVPCVAGIQPGRLLRTRGLPRGLSMGAWLQAWLDVLLSLLLGACTHLLWDGFTHEWMWPARVLYPGVRFYPFGFTVPLAYVFQHLSSILGAFVVTVFVVRLYRRLPEAPCGSAPRFFHLWLMMAVFTALGVLLHLYPIPQAASVRRTIWYGFWTGMDAMFLGFTLACLMVQAQRRFSADR